MIQYSGKDFHISLQALIVILKEAYSGCSITVRESKTTDFTLVICIDETRGFGECLFNLKTNVVYCVTSSWSKTIEKITKTKLEESTELFSEDTYRAEKEFMEDKFNENWNCRKKLN